MASFYKIILLTTWIILFLQGHSKDGGRDVIVLSDSDGSFDHVAQGLDSHVHCARCNKPFRRLVIGLSAVRAVPVETFR